LPRTLLFSDRQYKLKMAFTWAVTIKAGIPVLTLLKLYVMFYTM
jgi:hypothetical protein